MAVETTNAFSGPFLPNGATTTFPFTFTAPSAAEVSVVARAADGSESELSGYAVVLTPDGGGSVIFDVAPAAGPQLYILLDPFFTQQVEFENGSGWLAEPVNEVADRSASRDQVLKRDIARALQFPLGETGVQLPPAATRANGFLAFDPLGRVRRSAGTGADEGLREDLGTVGGAELIMDADGGIFQDAVNVAADTVALLASTKPLTVGSTVRTADGFVYKVAPLLSGNAHLATASGALLYVIPQGPSARQWGVFPDMGVDVWVRLQLALAFQQTVELELGEYLITRGLRQTRNGSWLRGVGKDKTIIRAISPTADDEFGGTVGSEAVVWAEAPEGAPLFGLKCEDMTLDCAGLMTGLPAGDVHLKGHHYRRVQDFEVNRVKVIECGSYAFWANDKTIDSGGTITGCSGTYNDCDAVDAEIFFETTGRCYITYNRPRAYQTRGAWAWPVQETYHFYGGDGLITVNDGYAKVDSSSIIAPLFTQKNVIWNGGYYEQLNAGTTVINLGGLLSSNFDNWVFNDVVMVAAGQVGAVSFGGGSGATNKMTFRGGKYIGLNGTGLTFTAISANWGSIDLIGVECKSTTLVGVVPFSLIVTGTFKGFHVIGGSQEAYGPSVGATPVNAPDATFTDVRFVPSTVVTERIRQSKRISQAFASGGGGAYGQINFAMPMNLVATNRLVAAGHIYPSSTAAGGSEAVAWSANNPSGNIVNILAPAAAIGRTWNGLVQEIL